MTEMGVEEDDILSKTAGPLIPKSNINEKLELTQVIEN